MSMKENDVFLIHQWFIQSLVNDLFIIFILLAYVFFDRDMAAFFVFGSLVEIGIFRTNKKIIERMIKEPGLGENHLDRLGSFFDYILLAVAISASIYFFYLSI